MVHVEMCMCCDVMCAILIDTVRPSAEAMCTCTCACPSRYSRESNEQLQFAFTRARTALDVF